MAAPDTVFLPAFELASLVRRGELSAEELTAATLDRIEAAQTSLNAFITVCRAEAMAAARAADMAVKRGEALGPLHGVPV